jgi:mannose-6-phosphate isomerase-like protein (cupin superfamily)
MNISKAKDWFEVLQTSKRAQTAMMTLSPGQANGSEPEGHKGSDQVLLMLEGDLAGEVGREKIRLTRGDVVIIPAGVKHRFKNESTADAVTFNVYSPPEYPAETKK